MTLSSWPKYLTVLGVCSRMLGSVARNKAIKLFCIKLARGGLVDLEFLTHYLQLQHGAGLEGGLTPFLGDALAVLVAAGLAPESLGRAHDALTRLLVALRLLAPDSQTPPAAACAALARSCGYGDWQALLAGIAEARGAVANAWHDILGEKLEV